MVLVHGVLLFEFLVCQHGLMQVKYSENGKVLNICMVACHSFIATLHSRSVLLHTMAVCITPVRHGDLCIVGYCCSNHQNTRMCQAEPSHACSLCALLVTCCDVPS